jgi:hypothetical protein
MSDPAVPSVPPGSMPLREVAHAVDRVVAMAGRVTAYDELTHLRIMRDRACLARQSVRLLADYETDDRDVMVVAPVLCDQAAQLRDDICDRVPGPS